MRRGRGTGGAWLNVADGCRVEQKTDLRLVSERRTMCRVGSVMKWVHRTGLQIDASQHVPTVAADGVSDCT